MDCLQILYSEGLRRGFSRYSRPCNAGDAIPEGESTLSCGQESELILDGDGYNRDIRQSQPVTS